jgi:hypothetical protein
MRDRSLSGRTARGSKLSDFYSEKFFISLLNEINNNKFNSLNEILEKYNIPKYIMYQILSGKTWTHITKEYDLNIIKRKINFGKPYSILSEDDVRDIKSRIINGERNVDIAKLYNVKRKTISDIRCGNTWSKI